MRRALLITFFTSACAMHVAPPKISLPAVRAETCAVPPKEQDAELYAGPASFTHDFQHRGLEDTLFAKCDVFMSEYWIRIGGACDAVAHDLADAPTCYAGSEPCREDRAGRDEMLGTAAAEHITPSCRAWSTRIAWGDAIGSDASCAPGHDVARGPITLAPGVVVSMRDVPVGAWTYAIALEPHLTALGKQYLRKFLVCQALETEASQGDAVRLHRYLVTDDTPQTGSEPQ